MDLAQQVHQFNVKRESGQIHVGQPGGNVSFPGSRPFLKGFLYAHPGVREISFAVCSLVWPIPMSFGLNIN